MKKEISKAEKIKNMLNFVINKEILPVTKIKYDVKTEPAAHIEQYIHILRVALKRLQALWHLMSPFIKKIEYQREKQKIFAARKLLGVTRDEAIKIATLKNLLDHDDNKRDRLVLTNILIIMQKHPIRYSQRSIQKTIITIKQSLASFNKIEASDIHASCFKQQLINSFTNTKRRVIKVDKHHRNNDLHRLRIHSKRFLYEMQFLQTILPNKCHKKIDKLNTMQQKLGLVHDLMVTRNDILSHQELFAHAGDIHILIKCIKQRKNALRKQSMKLSKELFLAKHTRLYKDIEKLKYEWSVRSWITLISIELKK